MKTQTTSSGPMLQQHSQALQRPLRLVLMSVLAAAGLLSGCAAPIEPYPAPPPEAATAEVQLNLMPPSRNRGAGLYVRGAVKCSPPGLAARLSRTFEEPPKLVGGSWLNRRQEVVRLPAGQPLPLRFRYTAPGDDWNFDFVVLLQPGAKYVFDHEIPGRSFTLTDSSTGQPAPRLPAQFFHLAMNCPA